MGRLKHRDTRHLWWEESLRKGVFGLNVMDASMDTADVGTKYLNATTRRTLFAFMPLCFGESLRMATMVAASREAGNTASATTAAYVTIAQYNSESFHGQITVGGSVCT